MNNEFAKIFTVDNHQVLVRKEIFLFLGRPVLQLNISSKISKIIVEKIFVFDTKEELDSEFKLFTQKNANDIYNFYFIKKILTIKTNKNDNK